MYGFEQTQNNPCVQSIVKQTIAKLQKWPYLWSSSSSEENTKAAAPKRKWKPPKKPQAGQKKRKREVEDHEEDENEQLDVLGAEAMALQLLNRWRPSLTL